jgi:hypothetical protein
MPALFQSVTRAGVLAFSRSAARLISDQFGRSSHLMLGLPQRWQRSRPGQ